MYRSFFKHILDFLIAITALLALSPIIISLIIILLVVNRGKPFFFQERPGKYGHIFKIIKFKTMRDLNANDGKDVHNLNRVTKAGAFIRKYSLDEILQLVNVLKGDMSLIGPRPLLIEYLPLYNETQKKRHNVRPGITGWAQVKGRNAITWEQKFNYDVWYVSHISIKLDIKILLLTILKVIKKDGINTSNDTIMPAWEGNGKN